MTFQIIKFDEKHYCAVKNYFDSNSNLFSKPERMEEYIAYFSNKTQHGIILEKKESMGEKIGVVMLYSSHPEFSKIKKDLEEITKE